MMTRGARRFTQGDITRAVQGVRRAGCEPSGVSIDSNGRILVQIGDGAKVMSNSWDDVIK